MRQTILYREADSTDPTDALNSVAPFRIVLNINDILIVLCILQDGFEETQLAMARVMTTTGLFGSAFFNALKRL